MSGYLNDIQVYGPGFLSAAWTVLWQLLVSNAPASSSRSPAPAPAQPEGQEAGGVQWGVFGTAPVLAVICSQIATNNQGNTIHQWGPTYFSDVLSTDPSVAGRYMALAGTVSFIGGFGVAAVESAMVLKKIPTLTIRKLMVVLNALGNSTSLMWFGYAKTPQGAALAFTVAELFGCLQTSGYNPNYREVGGEDTAVVAAVGNTAANVTGMLVPFLGVALRKMSGGSWLPLFGYAALLNLATAAFFATSASVTPARTLLLKGD